MSITIVKKQVVGPATARKAVHDPGVMSSFAMYRRVRSMAIGHLLLSYPEMTQAEAEARIDDDVVCNPLHASALKLKAAA